MAVNDIVGRGNAARAHQKKTKKNRIMLEGMSMLKYHVGPKRMR